MDHPGTSENVETERTLRGSLPFDPLSARSQLEDVRRRARCWAEGLCDESRVSMTSAFVRRSLLSYCTHARPGGAHLVDWDIHPMLSDPAIQLAERAGNLARALPAVEALHRITGLYPSLQSHTHRTRFGSYYTPPVLSARLLNAAASAGVDWTSARILDPACGGATFLVQAARLLRRSLRDAHPAAVLEEIEARLCGFELDPGAAQIGQMALEVYLCDLANERGRKLGRIVHRCDSLNIMPSESFDLVIGNPPYGRVSLSAEQRARYSRGLYGHANLYGLFTDLALRWSTPDGVVAYITPTSFLSGQYFSSLRRLLLLESRPVSIEFVHARSGVFEDVLQETLLTVYSRNRAHPARPQVSSLDVVSELKADVVATGTIEAPSDGAAPWLAPRKPADRELIHGARALKTRLSHLGYRVSTGPLVWNRHKDQLTDTASTGAKPLIWAESVLPGGAFRHRAEKRSHALYFEPRAGDDWLILRRPCVLVQRTTAKEQARRLIAAELPAAFVDASSGVVVENHLNMLIAERAPAIPALVLVALFNSDVVDQLFRCMSGSVAVSAYELESLPLPGPSEMRKIAEFLAEGGGAAGLNARLRSLYGLAPP
ncbi:MAG TPA: N-6 DNA methylase [Caulobacteraceae bacterium]|nr:N-6 DNA methylase [Caulobacteraceae bacterium]